MMTPSGECGEELVREEDKNVFSSSDDKEEELGLVHSSCICQLFFTQPYIS